MHNKKLYRELAMFAFILFAVLDVASDCWQVLSLWDNGVVLTAFVSVLTLQFTRCRDLQRGK